MATTSPSPAPQKKKAGNFPDPPKRGQIKAQIFDGVVKFFSTVSKAGGAALGKITGNGGGGGGSASSTPPPSAYNSEGSSDVV